MRQTKTSLFSFNLPDELVARTPVPERGGSRLMVLNRQETETKGIEHSRVAHLKNFVEPGTLMIFNDTRVRRARFFARNAKTGGKGEFIFLESRKEGVWVCLTDKSRKRKEGQEWIFPGDVIGRILEDDSENKDGVTKILKLNSAPGEEWFETYGHMPLPPYMGRMDNLEDMERYQTVYAKKTGSAAAPTAGLHFTRTMLDDFSAGGIELAWVTLNVGIGTFLPVRTKTIEAHRMHTESYYVPEETSAAFCSARRAGRKVLAVGTTTVRTLESAWNGAGIESGAAKTELFISPGYKFKAVDEIITNFHTPQSTLLMMMAAFCGRSRILNAYRVAVAEEYKFYSYGDAMYIR